jgi:hypothetical protein
MKAVVMLLCAALLAGAGPQDVEDYARREAQSRDLEEFQGGHVAVLLVLIGGMIGGLVGSAFTPCELCGRSTYEELPPWEGPPPAPLSP